MRRKFYKPTTWKVLIFLFTTIGSFLPLVTIKQSHPMIVLPIVQIFWLDELMRVAGLSVTDGPPLDAFMLYPPNILGICFIVLGTLISIFFHYTLASLIVFVANKFRS